MTEVITPPQPETARPAVHYLPIREFVQQMQESKEANPYSSTFSFAPFIEKMKERKMDLRKVAPELDWSFLEEVKEKLIAFSDPDRLDTPEKRQEIIGLLFPSLFFEGQLGFVGQPFSRDFFYMTPALREIFNSTEWELKVAGQLREGRMGSPALEAGKLILNTFYGQEIDTNAYDVMVFRHNRTLLERHFKVRIVLDYIRTTPRQALKQLDEHALHRLFNECDNEAYWLEQFPPEDYEFEGLVIGYIEDVTEAEVLSSLKEMMLSDEDEEVENSGMIRRRLQALIRTFLQMPDVDFGGYFARDYKYAAAHSWSLLGDVETLVLIDAEAMERSPTYGRVFGREEPVIIVDLQALEQPGAPERRLIELGYRSLLLSPQRDKHGRTFGMMELASKQPYRFNRQLLKKLDPVISLYAVGTNRWIQSIDNTINNFIQEQFTYIHPSVLWKFLDVSQKYIFECAPETGKKAVLEPIVFKDVYPLYGQADIVGSSQVRNQSIQADMLDNLQRVQEVIRGFREKLSFQLLDIYLDRTEAFSRRLESDSFVSSDESQIVELLTQEIHPLLRELGGQYPQLPRKLLDAYFDYLDPKLNIVYRRRKAYEDSVQAINDLISEHIEREVAQKQEVLPHFFEKYVTDGVAYNIYLGQSILETGRFSAYFLRDFRLWQLIQMCEITRLVERHGQELHVPLSTAQLIFIYNNPLSIRFNTDEKQFDVDGAYNVRYEILKKRIDKALIKGTKERLTQRGKIAMVWLQDRDRAEYLDYIEHLRRQGYLTGEVEELELERLQGADGLRALRVTVQL